MSELTKTSRAPESSAADDSIARAHGVRVARCIAGVLSDGLLTAEAIRQHMGFANVGSVYAMRISATEPLSGSFVALLRHCDHPEVRARLAALLGLSAPEAVKPAPAFSLVPMQGVFEQVARLNRAMNALQGFGGLNAELQRRLEDAALQAAELRARVAAIEAGVQVAIDQAMKRRPAHPRNGAGGGE